MADKWLVETTPHERFSFYTRANIGEVFPDPVAPLSFTWFENEDGIGGAEWGFRDAYYRIGVMTPDELPPNRAVFLGVSGGYGYLNASALRLLGHRAPGMTYKDIDDAFFGDAPGVPEFNPEPGDDRPELTAKIGATFHWVMTTQDLPDVAADEEIVNRLRADRPDLSAMTDRQLVEHAWGMLEDHFSRMFSQHIFVTFLATVPVGVITQVAAAIGNHGAVLRLVSGVGDVESAAPSMAMWQLGRRVANSAALTELFDGGAAGLDGRLRSSSASDPDVAAFVQAFDDFLFAFGSRGPNEWEARSPTWETVPDLALAAIDRMRLAGADADPRLRQEARSAEREALGAQITELLAADPETQGQFAAALGSSTVFLPGRERTKTNCIKLIHEARMALREWGRRSVGAGTFPTVNAYGLLTRAEMFQFLDSEEPGDYHDLLADREELLAEVTRLQEPFLFVGEPPPMSTYPRRDAVEPSMVTVGEVLQGIPGCTGSARGTARVVLDPHRPEALGPGEILVAPITDPSWTPLFVPASAVVVDVGAPLSHAVIVSRELGIPCVVSVIDATRRIPDGATIDVDGDTGKITVLELP